MVPAGQKLAPAVLVPASLICRPVCPKSILLPLLAARQHQNLQLHRPFSERPPQTINPNRINISSITMARPKKVAEEKAKEGATLSIDVDSFVRTRDSVSLIPLPHSSSSSSKTRRIRHRRTLLLKRPATTLIIPSPPHLNNHPSYTLGRLESHIPTPPRPYPERIIVASSQLTSLHERASIVYIGTLAS